MTDNKDNQIELRDSGGINRRSETARRGSDAAGFVRGLAKRENTPTRPAIGNQDSSLPDSMSRFEEEVEQALISKGYLVHRQVLVVNQRIDLAIVSDNGQRYDLGIECKGGRYHSQPTTFSIASEAQRGKTLRDEGWTIHTIESKEWFWAPELEIEKLIAALNTVRINS